MKSSCALFIFPLNFLCRRTFTSIVNFVIRSWFFSVVRFWVYCVFDFLFDFRKSREWELIVDVVLFRKKKKNLKLRKKSFLFFVFLFAFSSVRRLKVYSLLFFSFLCWNFLFRLFDRLLFWIQKSVNSFKKKKRDFLMKNLS
jgi:hypothetical protein